MSKTSVFVLLLFLSASPSLGQSPHETVLYAFPPFSANGDSPQGAMTADGAGNLYGTTEFGGSFNSDCVASGCGTVFELSPPSQQGEPWTETVIYGFQGGADGDAPECTPVRDKDGNLYGTSIYGFYPDGGVIVWQLSPPTESGRDWAFTTLYVMPDVLLGGNFNAGNLTMDRTGNLYGTTTGGGGCVPFGCGAVYEVLRPQQSGGTWAGNVIYNFQGGSGGQNFSTTLAIDNSGALYGGASTGSSEFVYQLVPPSNSGGSWTEKVIFNLGEIASFNGLAFDGAGNLYGASVDGPEDELCIQNRQGCGYVFQLSPQPGGDWTETILHNFLGHADGWYPTAIPAPDALGDLYGTTYFGWKRNLGTVYRLTKGPGDAWTERLVSLAGDLPIYPSGSLIFGPDKAVIGTGTAFSGGGVFSVSIP